MKKSLILILTLFGWSAMAMGQICDVEVETFGDYDMDGKRFVVRALYSTRIY